MSSIRVAAEDRFVVVDMTPRNELFADGEVFEHFIDAVIRISKWEILFDFRSPDMALYNDVLDQFESAKQALKWSGRKPIALVHPDSEWAPTDAKTVRMEQRPLTQRSLDAAIFDGDDSWLAAADAITNSGYDSFMEAASSLGAMDERRVSGWRTTMESVAESSYYVSGPKSLEKPLEEEVFGLSGMVANGQAAYLDNILRGFACNSILTEVAIQVDGDGARVIPYHAHSLHEVPSGLATDIVHLRPGRVSGNYVRRFREQIDELERMIASPQVREADIQFLLDSNPLFLRGLNYDAVYTNVVLTNQDGTSLKPDVIAEPASEEWAHIIDLKLPSAKVLVGRENRARLAHGIHEVAAQLREYAAYFDDRDVARQVEQRYGFKCYKPKLVAIIGRDPVAYSDEERRRVLSSQPDLEVLTYDQLLGAAKQELLF